MENFLGIFFNNILGLLFVPALKNNIASGQLVFSQLVNVSSGFLTQDPASFNSEAWGVVEKMNGVLIGIGSTLVVIFFLIGFFEESVDPKQELRFEVVLKMFIKLAIAEFFVVNSLSIVRGAFGFVRYITNGLGLKLEMTIKEDYPTSFTSAIEHIVQGQNDIGLFTLLMSSLFAFVLIACGVIILYQAFTRMIKILTLVPYGALANSTLSGNHTIKQTAVSFWKYALCTILEAVTMLIALAICVSLYNSSVISSVFHSVENSFISTGTQDILYWMLERVIYAITTCGVIKGASALTQRVLGL